MRYTRRLERYTGFGLRRARQFVPQPGRSSWFRRVAGVALCVLLAGCAAQPARNLPGASLWYTDTPSWQAARGRDVVLQRGNGKPVKVLPAAVVSNLETVTRRMRAASGVPFVLALIDVPQPNAFALRVDVVALSLPLLDAVGEDPDALAGIVGHELAHIRLGHGVVPREEREREAIQSSAAIAGALGAARVPFASTMAGISAVGRMRAATREEEREADTLGASWTLAAGYDPCAMLRVLRSASLRAHGGEGSYLSTHPAYSERFKLINALVKKAGRRGCTGEPGKAR